MNIFVDESGSFVAARNLDSWNCVAAYVSPEIDRKLLRDSMRHLKSAAGVSLAAEIKLREVSESDYFDFLVRLGRLRGILFVVATDAGLNTVAEVGKHQQGQAAKIVEHKDKMIHPSGRQALVDLGTRVGNLAPQLYVQLICQLTLIAAVLQNAVLYFVQRLPKSLGRFRWRIDQKNSSQTEYEEMFVTITPPILQSISLSEPFIMLKGADYSAFRRFDFSEQDRPTYLQEVYGIEARSEGPALNLGKIMREDLRFEDSKKNQGVQVADLLAAGVRRCLRKRFKDNHRAALLLGTLMVQGKARHPPIQLVTLSENEAFSSGDVGQLVKAMQKRTRAMLTD